MRLTALAFLAAIGCAHTPPSLVEYGAAYGQCMADKGIAEAPELGAKVFDILDAGAFSAGTLSSQLEALLTGAGTTAIKDAISCAVTAWFSAHPVAANAKPTAAQAACRVFLARRAAGQ